MKLSPQKAEVFMKMFGITILVFSIAQITFAKNCNTDAHPKDKAECVVMSAIKDKSNSQINAAVKSLEKSGMTGSGEIGSIFIGGNCELEQTTPCAYNYLVSTDYSSSSGTYKSIVVQVTSPVSPTEMPLIIKVLDLK